MPPERDIGRVLVTGGAGFIGSALVRHLLAETGAPLLNFDALTYAGLPESVAEPAGDARYRFVHGDVTDAATVARVIEEFDPQNLIHLAAESHVDRSIAAPNHFVKTNVVGTATLLEAWRRRRDERLQTNPEAAARMLFLHVSTDEVYGPVADGVAACEGDRYRPSSPYAASKAAADHLVGSYQRTYGLPAIITHATNNYGPRQFPEKLIPLVVERCLADEPIPLYGDGQQSRDWLHVDDHCRALVRVATRGEPGESYHLGAEDVRTNRSVVEAICDLVDELAPGAKPRRGLIEHVADRPGHDQRYALDASKARDRLGWSPRLAFEAGLRRTVAWQLENRDWVTAAMRRVDAGR